MKNVPSGLKSLKSKVDKLDIGKLETTLVVQNVVKKTEYNELVKKVNNISTTDPSNLVKKLIKTQKLVELKIK